MSEHDDLATEVGAQDEEFFDKNPGRAYRVRPADPRELDEILCDRRVFNEERHQPAIIVKRFFRNGYELMTRKLFGAPKDVNLCDVGEELARSLFEPALH
jgi:hypothetical protein